MKDIKNKFPLLISPAKQNNHINNFDSLRGIAALLVVVAHVPGINQPSLGATGVWIFFVLSGFLLYWFFENKSLREVILTTPCAYSFYLWHILIINGLKLFTSNVYIIFFITVIGSYIMAVYTYYFIENTSLIFSKKYQLKIRRVG